MMNIFVIFYISTLFLANFSPINQSIQSQHLDYFFLFLFLSLVLVSKTLNFIWSYFWFIWVLLNVSAVFCCFEEFSIFF